ncbi:hypothetical protein BH10PLA2_BH10PLA2_39560 [soil metagenome]
MTEKKDKTFSDPIGMAGSFLLLLLFASAIIYCVVKGFIDDPMKAYFVLSLIFFFVGLPFLLQKESRKAYDRGYNEGQKSIL